MASSEPPPLSLRNGIRVQPDPTIPVETVLMTVGDLVGHSNLIYASRMNKGVVIFLKEERFVNQLIVSGVTVGGEYLQVSPLAVPSTRVIVSGVPPFIPNVLLEKELQRFGKLASGFKTVGLGCKHDKLKHVQSFRRQVFMFLNSATQTLEVSFRVKYEEGSYMVYASTGSMKCFECGDVGHKRASCPHKNQGDQVEVNGRAEESPVVGAPPPVEDGAFPPPPVVSDAGEGSSGLNKREDTEKTGTDVPKDSSDESNLNVETDQTAGCAVAEAAALPEGGAAEDQSAASPAQVEDMEYDSDSDSVSVADSQTSSGDLYTLEEINDFLDETFGKQVKVLDHFPDAEKFIKSVSMVQKIVGFEMLDEKKRFRLKKHMTNARKHLSLTKVKGSKRLKTQK